MITVSLSLSVDKIDSAGMWGPLDVTALVTRWDTTRRTVGGTHALDVSRAARALRIMHARRVSRLSLRNPRRLAPHLCAEAPPLRFKPRGLLLLRRRKLRHRRRLSLLALACTLLRNAPSPSLLPSCLHRTLSLATGWVVPRTDRLCHVGVQMTVGAVDPAAVGVGWDAYPLATAHSLQVNRLLRMLRTSLSSQRTSLDATSRFGGSR